MLKLENRYCISKTCSENEIKKTWAKTWRNAGDQCVQWHAIRAPVNEIIITCPFKTIVDSSWIEMKKTQIDALILYNVSQAYCPLINRNESQIYSLT